MTTWRIVRTRRGVSLRHGLHVVSELPARPGPTHSVFDVLAAAVAELSPGPRVALLGFAGGGLVAPLRALGCPARIRAIDLEPAGARLFDEVAGEWGGDVSFEEAEASAWLRRRRERFDAVIEDLSMQVPGEVVKPAVSVDLLPSLVARRLARRGVSVTNVLPCPGRTWREIVGAVAAPYPEAFAVTFDEFVNRIVIGGAALPTTRELATRLRQALTRIGSRQARRIHLRRLRG